MNLTDSDPSTGEHRKGVIVQGRVSSGLGEGKVFTQLPWAKAQFIGKLGIDPFPGTFNLSLEDPEAQKLIYSLRQMAGVEIVPDSPKFCAGKCFSVILGGTIVGAVVFPEVDDYPLDKLEIIAPINIKSALKVDDGDSISVTLLTEPLPFG